MEMTDELRDNDDDTGAEQPPAPAPKKRRGRPRGSAAGGKPPTARFERRAKKSAATVRELVRLGVPELDVSELTFAETVDRDADEWGNFLAQVGEWFPPFGVAVDLLFGSALVHVLRMAPSFRAARRDVRARTEERQAARDAALEAQAHEEELAAQREQAAETGVFAPAPPHFGEVPAGQSREEWLANGGGG
jgi:hypothetical protein